MTDAQTDRLKSYLAGAAFALDVCAKISCPFLLGAAGVAWSTAVDHERRIQRIEDTGYTREDARAAKDDLRDLIVRLAQTQAVQIERTAGLAADVQTLTAKVDRLIEGDRR